MDLAAKDRRGEGTTVLRQTQLTLLYLLDVFAGICEARGLRYYLGSGTLLGAMRHNGFIPWDDDLDVGMPEEDYKEFLKIAPDLLPQGVLLQKPGQYPQDFIQSARLRDRRSFFCEWYTNVDVPSGIFMDIFPVGKYPKMSREFGGKLRDAYEMALFCEQAHRIKANRNLVEMIFHFGMSGAWLCVCGALKIFYLILRGIRPTVWNIKFGAVKTSTPGVPAEVLFPLGKHVFEGREYSVPHDPDRYLTAMYGDWRTPPPESERHGDHKTALILPMQAPKVWWAMPYEGGASTEGV